MSVVYYCYLGPALLCKPSEKIVKVDYYICPECGAEYEKGTKFCSADGSKIEIKQREEKEEGINLGEVIDKLDDNLTYLFTRKDNEHIFTPNIDRNPPREFQFDCIEQQVSKDLTFINQQDEIKWFEREFAKEISKIDKIYGSSNVRIAWIWTNKIY